MRLEALDIALRARTGWEAIELGSALARRHFGAVWKPWWLLGLPLWAAVNAACWALDALWLAPLLMWWLKPLFDRIPLFVLSRAAFGQVPNARQTLRAAFGGWGRAFLLAHLSWRRLSPVRALHLPVDLLEGSDAAAARERRRTLGGPAYGVAALLMLVFVHFEIALYFGLGALALVFVPEEHLQPALHGLWQAMQQQAGWLGLAGNAALWLATSVLEPFYVGAGFGLYLNRRTEIEGWDIEIALRRLRARLQGAAGASALAVVLALGALPLPARAQDAPAASATPREVFGDAYVDDGSARKAADAGLRRAVEQAYADPRLSPKRTLSYWKSRKPPAPERRNEVPVLRAIGEVFAVIAEFGLWILLGALALALLLSAPRWWPWLRDGVSGADEDTPAAPRTQALETAPPLPEDIVAAARRLWREGRARDALALMYRAAVEAMAARVQVVPVPGATEAECLRLARRLPEAEDRDAFAEAVRLWQYAAYAQRLPEQARFEQVLQRLGRRFGWTA